MQVNLTSNDTLHGYSLGAKYSYHCTEEGFVIDMRGYPEEVVVE